MYKIINCAICHRDFNGQISGIHLKNHGTNTRDYELKYGPARDPQLILDAKNGGKKGGGNQGAIDAHKRKREYSRTVYLTTPKQCKACSVELSYEKRHLTFCSQSCSATHNNNERDYALYEKVKKTWADRRVPKQELAPHSKLILNTCRHCKIKFVNRYKIGYCKEHIHLHKSLNRARYYFKFNVFHYPDLFDLNELTRVGFYNAGGNNKRGINMNGLSRDHRVSVSEAMLNNYDEYYIRHPVNCDLMPQNKNSRKHSKSSITYEQLVREVDDYDNRGDH